MSGLNDRLAKEIAISQVKGVHRATVSELLERIGGIDNYFTLSKAELHHLTGIKSDIFDEGYRRQLMDFGDREAAIVREKYIDASMVDDETYPQRLQQCEDAPVMLYKYGSTNLDSMHTVGIVGTRHATAYGLDFTHRLVKELAEKIDGLMVISGLAYGIDAAAHRASLEYNVPTVGVLAHGLSRIYPAEHRQIAAKMTASGGALVTEYTYNTGPQKQYFLARNRIIAGLSDCVIVVESDIKGGAMSTARSANLYNRDVFAVPGRVNDRYSRGTNQLISNHTAALIQDAEEVIAQMGWSKKKESETEAPQLFRPLSEDEQELLDFIKANPEATVNDLCVRLNKSFAMVSNIMFQLEMEDIIVTLPGGRYAPTTKI